MSGIARLQRQQLTIIRTTAGFNVGHVGHSKGGRPKERGKGPGSRSFFRACDRVRIKHSNSGHFKNYHDVAPLTSQLYRIYIDTPLTSQVLHHVSLKCHDFDCLGRVSIFQVARVVAGRAEGNLRQ